MRHIRCTELGDRELVSQAGQGEPAAFAELYRRHADAAWRAARAVTSDQDDAADAVADAFTRTLQKLRSGRANEITHIRAYLATAARHAVVDKWRARPEVVDDAALHELPARTPSPAETVIDLTDGTLAAKAFDGLPDRWRRILWLTEIQQLSPGAAAEMLGMKPNAAYQLAFRARAGLREQFVREHLEPAAPDRACAETVRQLASYVLGTLRTDAHRGVETHLEQCDACRERQREAALVAPRARC